MLALPRKQVGYRKLYEDDNDKKIAKDESILQEGEATRTTPGPVEHKKVCGVIWHFIQNPTQLHCGPDPALKARFPGGCRPAVYPIQLPKDTKYSDLGTAGELMLAARVQIENKGKAPGLNWKFRTKLVTEREVDVTESKDEAVRNNHIQCILHCPGGREILPESMK